MSQPHPVPSPDDSPIGRTLGPWRVEARLGSGGIATVWRAVDAQGRLAALKVVPLHLLGPEDLRRFEREARALTALDHPHVVKVLGQGRTDTLAWIALEYVDGEDLESLIRRWREAPPPDRFVIAERVFRELASALQHVHDLGWIHRDVKPANVLLGRDGRTRLTDFGVVSSPEISRITLVGRLVGTIAYMAPELIAEEPADPRADLYGLGATLYAMLARRRPIEADSVAGYLARHLTTAPQPPHEIDPEVPRHLERVALRLLEKDPARRYASARAAVEALDRDESSVSVLHDRADATTILRERVERRVAGVGGVVAVIGPRGSGRSAVLRQGADLARAAGLTVADARDPEASTTQVVLADDVESLPPEARRRLDAALGHGALVIVAEFDGRGSYPSQDVAQIRLQPLGRRAVAQLLRDRGMPTAPATALAGRLHEAGATWPGAVVQQLEALVRDGWLERRGRGFVALRPVEDFRDQELPVPEEARTDLGARLRTLGEDELELLELLALLGRAAGATLLARAASRPARAPATVERLVHEGWIRAEADEEDMALRLASPTAVTVIREAMPPQRRRERHLALARVLSRRRRRGAHEAAQHLALAGRPEEAVPLFLAAARQDLEGGQPADALRSADAATAVLAQQGDLLRPDEADRWRRLLASLRGTALLGLGRWPEAVPALEDARQLARQSGDPRAIARAASDLGRALYRLGRLDRAAEALEEALRAGTPGDPEVESARRALADVHLQHGRLDGAMMLLRDALQSAVERGSADDEARARRGIAHVLGLERRYGEAAAELDTADDLLAHRGDPRVRAGVLIRALELDTAAGRYGQALHRADLLVDLLETHGYGAGLPEALAASAEIRVAVGHDDEAAGLARRALLLARTRPAASWAGIVGGTRVLARLGRVEPEDAHLLRAAAEATSPIRRPEGQALALLARVLAPTDPDAAREALAESRAVPAAAWSLVEALRQLDAALAHLALGDVGSARAALAGAEGLVAEDRASGIRLDLLLVRRATGDGSGDEVARQLVESLVAPLPLRLREGLRQRPAVAALLAGTPPPSRIR